MTEAKPANTAVSFQQPLNPQMALQQLAIQQRMAMAQKLMDQSQQPEGTQMVGGGNGVNAIAVPNSKIGGLAKMLGQAIGTNQYYGAAKDAAQMQGQYMQNLIKMANGGGADGGAGGKPGSGTDWQGIETALTAAGQKDMADMIQKNHPVTNNMADAEASGQTSPQALAKAMEVDKQGAAVGRFTVNGRPDVPMTNEQALGMNGMGAPSPQAMAAAIPGTAPVQVPAPPPGASSGPLPMANMSGAPSGTEAPFPTASGQPAMPLYMSVDGKGPTEPTGQLGTTGPVPETPGQAIGMGPMQQAPGTPPPGAMPSQTAPVIGGQTPQEKAALETQTAGDTKLNQDAATNKAEDIKVMHVMQSGLPMQLQRFQRMREDSKNASTGYGVNNEGDGWKQNALNSIGGPTATANNDLEKLSAQGVLGELGPQLAQAGIRGNKFLESIASSASALKMNAPVDSKMGLVDDLEKMYIDNFKATSSRLRDQGIAAPTDAQIDEMVKQQKGTAPSGMNNKSSPPVGTIEQGHRFKGGNPADPNSWEKSQ